jgi:hypothetical protein
MLSTLKVASLLTGARQPHAAKSAKAPAVLSYWSD